MNSAPRNYTGAGQYTGATFVITHHPPNATEPGVTLVDHHRHPLASRPPEKARQGARPTLLVVRWGGDEFLR